MPAGTALVAGAAGIIGRAVVRELAADPDVALTAIDRLMHQRILP